MRITERGQVAIPKRIRERYGIRAETELEVIETDRGILLVTKVTVSPFQRFVGRANAAGLPQQTDELLRQLRDDQ